MSRVKNIPPVFRGKAFVCPFCDIASTQDWHELLSLGGSTGFHISECDYCRNELLWNEKSASIIFPKGISSIALPLQEMPNTAKEFYNEARQIFQYSPRSACTLLRLSLEKLLPEVYNSYSKGTNLKKNIEELKQSGEITNDIYRALEVVRVVGNHSVHDKEINVNDTPEIAEKLFSVINHIVTTEIKNKNEHETFLQLIEQKAARRRLKKSNA